jgi:hypothetical protein
MSLGGLSLRGAALALAGGLAGSAITLGAVWLATPATRQVATIDLQGVIELQQLKLTAMVLSRQHWSVSTACAAGRGSPARSAL